MSPLAARPLPRPAWALEQDRLRPRVPGAPELPDRPSTRPTNERLIARLEASRVDMRPDRPATVPVAALPAATGRPLTAASTAVASAPSAAAALPELSASTNQMASLLAGKLDTLIAEVRKGGLM